MAFTTIIVEFSFRYRQLGLMLTRSPRYRILGMSVTGMLLRLPPPGRMWPIRRPKSSVGLPALLSA